MDSIEKILATLQRLGNFIHCPLNPPHLHSGNDKQAKLTQDYEDNSLWLSAQFELIRCLIETNPRDQLVVTEQQGNIGHVAVGQKRKSEENKRSGDSPELKRNSSELHGLLEAEGLPSDLQKMKKEQLVNELIKRGQTEYSMKNLKSELIDALKAILLGDGDEGEASSPDDPTETKGLMIEDVTGAQDADVVRSTTRDESAIPEVSSVSSKADSQPALPPLSMGPNLGRGSMVLSSIRSQVRESLAVENVSAKLHHPRASVEQELQARLLRHRDSQAMNPVQSLIAGVNEEMQSKDRASMMERGKMSEQVVPVVELLVGHDENLADDLISTDEIVTENIPEDLNTASNPIHTVTVNKPSNLISTQKSLIDVDNKKPLVPAILKAERLKEQEELKQAEKRKKEAERKVNYYPA